MERKPRTSAKLRKLQKRSKVISKQLKYWIPQPQSITQRLRTELKQIIELIRIQVHPENLQSRNRVKTLLSQKGVRALKLFWNLDNRKPKKKNTLEKLDLQAGLTSDQDQMNTGIKSFFEIKFNTSFNPEDIQRNAVNLDEIGTPEKKFSQETADEMMRPITLEELNQNLNELNISKAEGLDGVTNSMLKHSGVQVELGWKPIKLLIELSKLRFLQRVMADDFVGSQLLKACMDWNLADNNNFYTKNLMSFLKIL